MSISEFDIIRQYFQAQHLHRSDVIIGIGDDCAVLHVPADKSLAVSIDTLIAGVHFPDFTSPFNIGYKALAVNLSDLAAMGAQPAWFTCALTLPKVDEVWLDQFAAGLFALANKFNMQLVGGDLTHGHLSITIQVHGFVSSQSAIKRSGAKVGDKIYVSGQLGLAGYALQQLQNNSPVDSDLLSYLNRPEPRIDLGLALHNKANSSIDISDGLIADLSHILEASHVGASIYLDYLPIPDVLRNNYDLALTAGDDYQLCFTMPASIKIDGFDITCIGNIESEKGLRIFDHHNQLYTAKNSGYRHF